jgi:hypothetical protein
VTWMDRRRLDVPEVHRLLAACDRMLDDWAETEPGSPERTHLWRNVHRSADDLAARAYGGPTIISRLSYWIRPYDARLDDRVWRWNRPGPCRQVQL